MARFLQFFGLTMARIPRRLIIEDKSFFHVTWKCHNGSFLLQDGDTKTILYDLLLRYKSKYRIKIYGYCFMDNHPHIVGYCESAELFSRFFQVVNGSLARFINREMGRKGQVVMDRFRSPRIENERHLLSVLHYVDLNPVRAGVCKRASDYKWSSYRAHASAFADALIDELPSGVFITPTQYQNQSAYVLTQGRTNTIVYSNTFFIGTPTWVRLKRRELYQRFLRSKPVAKQQTKGA